ncbi:MAG: AI-2E family transporter [Lachnospiraceae bacterium]|nr:AI-2E family transporter [Lachnospiraceae bacterium]
MEAEKQKDLETQILTEEKETNEGKAYRLANQPHYIQWGITAFLVLAAAEVVVYLVFNTKSITAAVNKCLHILRPIIYGMVLAYLMAPTVNWIEGKLLKPLFLKLNKDVESVGIKKKSRLISIILTVAFFILLLYLFFASIIPQLLQSIQALVTQFPVYTQNMQDFIDNILKRNPELRTTVNTLLNNYNSELEDILSSKLLPKLNEVISKASSNILSSVAGVISTLWNLIIGLIVSIYLLGSKEIFAAQGKKLIYSCFSRERGNQVVSDFIFIKHTFADYISGKLIDSLIIGLLCFIGTTCLLMPYPLLISVIIGVTNIIPFFGPYLGAIPSALIILMVDPKKALIFVIFILILQQFDGNFLGPKILGDSTGLSSFWIIFAITVMGGYFGVIGMAVGVPIFAVLYAAGRALMNKSLRKKGLSENTADYRRLERIDEDKQYHYYAIEAPEPAEEKKPSGFRKNKKNDKKEEE